MEKCGEKDTNRKQPSSRLKTGLELEFFSMELKKNISKPQKTFSSVTSKYKTHVRVSYHVTSLLPVFVVSL